MIKMTKTEVEKKILSNVRTLKNEKYYWENNLLMVSYEETDIFSGKKIKLSDPIYEIRYCGELVKVTE